MIGNLPQTGSYSHAVSTQNVDGSVATTFPETPLVPSFRMRITGVSRRSDVDSLSLSGDVGYKIFADAGPFLKAEVVPVLYGIVECDGIVYRITKIYGPVTPLNVPHHYEFETALAEI